MIGAPHTVPTRWGATVTLSPFASVGATERALKAARILSPQRWSYAKDSDFARYPLARLTTMAEVEAFLAELDKAAARHGGIIGRCSKAHVARAAITRQAQAPWKFWEGREAEHAVLALSSARRTCCGCHETGSFARYFRGKRERIEYDASENPLDLTA